MNDNLPLNYVCANGDCAMSICAHRWCRMEALTIAFGKVRNNICEELDDIDRHRLEVSSKLLKKQREYDAALAAIQAEITA